MTDFKPGLYFGMAEDEYHAIPALSSSGFKHLLVSGPDFWVRSWMNPNRKEEATPQYFMDGSAYHKRILEGRDAFRKCYAPAFNPDMHPDALKTVEDMKLWLKGKEEKISGKKEELIIRIMAVSEADPQDRPDILDVLRKEYEDGFNGHDFIKPEVYEEIEMAAAQIEMHPQLSKCFTGGYPEVTVLWVDEDTDLPMKARLDYLKHGAVVDLKTFANTQNKPIDRAIYAAMASQKYHIQATHYLDAAQHAVSFASSGDVHGEAQGAWVEKFGQSKDHQFVFVFQQKCIPVAKGKVFPKSLMYDCAVAAINEAKNKYLHFLKKFGTEMWVDDSTIDMLCDEEYPIYMTEI